MRSFVWMAILGVACDGGSGGGAVSVESFPGELAELQCSRLVECCTTEELMEETLGADNEEECRTLFTSLGGLLADVIADSIASGRVVYDGNRMAACLSVLRGLSCTEFHQSNSGPFPTGCENPFEGLVALGGECAADFDCTSTYCSGDELDFNGNVTFGVCADAPVAGAPCDDFDCVEGAFCDDSGGTPTCAESQPDGSPCISDDECASENCDQTGMCGAPTCDGQ